MPAETQRARPDADQRVVLSVLQRIDRVIADHPQRRASIHRGERVPIVGAQLRPSNQEPPCENQSEPGLGPPGDPLHERVGRDQREAAQCHPLRQRAQLQQHQQPGCAQRQQPCPCELLRDTPAGDRARSGAGDFPVELGIDDIVVDAARTAHRDSPQQQPREQPQLPARAGQPHAPDAGPEQQPPADRPVEPRELRQVARQLREARNQPAVFAVGDDGFIHRAGPINLAIAAKAGIAVDLL